MRKGFTLFTILAFALATVAFAGVATDKTRIQNVRPIGGSNEATSVLAPAAPMGQNRLPNPTSLDVIGTIYQAGTTYYDYQHNGTKGRMITTDATGWVHVVWMNGLEITSPTTGPRHVFYNYWDPASSSFLVEGGVQVDGRFRGGYTAQAISSDGRCYPTFHQVITTADGHAHSAASIDFLPQTGAFSTIEPEYLIDSRCGTPEDMEILWPKITMDINGTLHMVACESPCLTDPGEPQRFYYSRGIPQIDENGIGESIQWEAVGPNDAQYLEIDTVMVIAPEIIASRNTGRLAMAWAASKENLAHDSASQINNDVVYMISEDGGLNWGPQINITRFPDPDWECVSGDTIECQGDTFRVYTDLNMLFDESDNLHIAFTTNNYFAIMFDRASGNNGSGSTYTFGYSQIWHWGEATDEVSPIRAVEVGYFPSAETSWTTLGDWQRLLQHPSMSIDPTTGDMYVAYQLVDTVSWSAAGIPIADAWVAKSVDCGRSWSEGTNVTSTIDGPATPAGECQHERDITLSQTVTYSEGVGYLHMEYVFDRDAGEAVGATPTGTVTLNPIYYQRIPITEIPATPRWDHTSPQLHVDGSQMPYGGEPNPEFTGVCPPYDNAADENDHSIPGSFKLYQNYPNPFNPSTQIQFDLAKNMNVTLSVFNVLGQEVATLLNDKPLSAGAQVIEFDATNLPSGVYVYQMKANGLTQSRKMVVLK
jgi:hypothetical protein